MDQKGLNLILYEVLFVIIKLAIVGQKVFVSYHMLNINTLKC